MQASIEMPEPVEATWRRNDAVRGMGQAIVDESGVYYFDADGALMGLPHGADEPEQLAVPPSTPGSVTGLVSDESTLYWGLAGVHEGRELGLPPPPGSLNAIAKLGGEAKLLRQADDAIFTPLGVSDDRIVVKTGAGVSLVATDGSSTVPLAYEVPSENLRFMDGKLYWTEPWEGSNDEVGYFSDLFRADPLGSEVEEVVRIEQGQFLAGHGFAVWWQERTHNDPLVLDQNLVVLDETTSCTRPLPGVGLTVSSQAVMDDRHAYWHSFNGLAGITVGTPLESVPLLRVDLRTGDLEELVTEGYVADLTHDTIGQTEGTLFFRVEGALVAIDKPR